jgi:TRAP transporter TAXI family solute receptor
MLAAGGTLAALTAFTLTPAPSGPGAIRIAAMPPGTSWYVFAATLTQLLEKQIPNSGGVEVFARGGGIGNPTLIERGKVEIALSQVATARWAWAGDPLAYQGVPHRRLRALVGGLNSVWITVIAREAYVARTGNDTLEKALHSRPGPRVILKPPGNTPDIALDMILEAAGTSRRQIAGNGGSIIQVSVSQIPDMLHDGRADLYVETAIKGHPTVTEVTTMTPSRFLDLPPQILERLRQRGLRPRPLPAWFKGQSLPTAAVDCGTVLIARDDLPEELAYLVTKTICENRDAMVRAHKAWSDFDPAAAGRLENTGVPLHAGAERYFRERGWL